jgi:ATP-dependent DNA ligase
LLRDAFDFQDPLRFTQHRERQGEAYYREACRRGWEGVMAKNGDSVYVSGRTREWLKFKCVKEQEFVIGGYTEPQGHRIGFGALLVGYYRRGKLVYAGKGRNWVRHGHVATPRPAAGAAGKAHQPFRCRRAAATWGTLGQAEAGGADPLHRVDDRR